LYKTFHAAPKPHQHAPGPGKWDSLAHIAQSGIIGPSLPVTFCFISSESREECLGS
jgi:hypothetical protein